MEILEIEMKHFGKFSHQKMMFHPGVNIIYGDNETGKSTMRAFIRGMFFGIDKARGRASETDEYNLRAPWEADGGFSGSMRLLSHGRVYRIERNFEKRNKTVRVICETDGTEPEADAILPSLLEGMSEAAFSNTVFFGRPSAQTDAGLVSAVKNGMINANMGGAGRVDVARALDELQEERKRLERGKKRMLAEQIEKMQELSMKIDYTQQEIGELAQEEQKLREELGRMDGETSEQQEDDLVWELENYRNRTSAGLGVWKIGKIAMALIAVAALAVGLYLTSWEARVGAAAVILLSCVGVRFFGVHDEERRERLREQELEQREERLRMQYERQRERLRRERAAAPRKQRLTMNLEWMVKTRKEKQELLERLQEAYNAKKPSQAELEKLEQELSAVYLAIDTMREATAETCREQTGKLNGRVSEILARITGGRYTGIFLDENLQVRIHTPQGLLSVWQVSRGTMEQIYFALRMACAEFLDPQERVPLILDDAFLTYDDARLEQTLRWLSESGRQVLLFTCQKREQEMVYSLSQENA